MQVGISTATILFCTKGGIFIRVTAFYNWILNMTSDATYCRNPLWFSSDTTILTTEETSKAVYTTKEQQKTEQKVDQNLQDDDPPANSNAFNIQIFIYLKFFIIKWISLYFWRI